jgi:aspartyl-tRNA(Asn)/glutamyl-tRNA(Gln) amidotransferase subunit C
MPSSLTKADVKRIAQLAHLELTEHEQELFLQQLGQILDYAERLQDVETTDVHPTWHPESDLRPLRQDILKPSLSTADALSNAPAPGPRNLFRVPKVIG